MSDELRFIAFDEAVALVGAIQEEEDIEQPNRRILTVYSKDDQELCWFDFEEVMADIGVVEAGQRKEAVQNYILSHIPEWVKEL